MLPPSHFFGAPFLEKEDLISGNVASIVGNWLKTLISKNGAPKKVGRMKSIIYLNFYYATTMTHP